jgi:hypothetical protein
MNTMHHFAHCLSLQTPKPQQICQLDLNLEWLHDFLKGIFNKYQN